MTYRVGLVLIIAAALLASAAGLTSVSPIKGKCRLTASCLLGLGIPLELVPQGLALHKPLLSLFSVIAGSTLALLGLRKFRRDPQGQEPAARI